MLSITLICKLNASFLFATFFCRPPLYCYDVWKEHLFLSLSVL